MEKSEDPGYISVFKSKLKCYLFLFPDLIILTILKPGPAYPRVDQRMTDIPI